MTVMVQKPSLYSAEKAVLSGEGRKLCIIETEWRITSVIDGRRSKMIDFIYHTPNLGDRVCGWIDELCREWRSSCFVSRNGKVGEEGCGDQGFRK